MDGLNGLTVDGLTVDGLTVDGGRWTVGLGKEHFFGLINVQI